MTQEPERTDAEKEPVPAATVALLRPADGIPFEVFLVKRHGRSRFMANAYVYPGGQLDEGDCCASLERHCRGVLAEDLAMRLGVDEEQARGLHVAALRELFEEAGAFLATESDGTEIDLENPEERERYETYREALRDEEVDFEQIIGWEDLSLLLDEIVYFAHWITPEIEPHRYDTRFFLARAPTRQRLIHDEQETTDSMWIAPADAIESYESGAIQLAPPTLMTLKQLAAFHSIDQALDHFRDRTIPTVLPHPIVSRGELTLLLPGDPEYPLPMDLPVDGPTRLVLAEGRWWAVDRETPDTTIH